MFNKMICGLLSIGMMLSLAYIPAIADDSIIASADYSGGDIFENGITALSNAVINEDGLTLIGSADATRQTDFDINNISVDLERGKNYYIEVSYKNSGGGFFYIKYKNMDGESMQTDVVYCGNENEIKTAVLKLSNPGFDIEPGGIDFSIDTAYNYNATQNYSSNPVYISSVRLCTDDTYSDASIDISSNNIGNIFYTGEDAAFRVDIENLRDIEQRFKITYNVYRVGDDDQKELISSSNSNVTISAGSKSAESFQAQVQKYGRYILEVIAEGGDRGTYSVSEAEFSKCVYTTAKSPTFGINTHTCKGRGSADAIFSLAKNAGITMARETINWEDYETTAGNRGLTETQKNALTTMRDKGIDLIMILYGNNRAYESGSDFVSESNIENYKNYIKSFVCEPEMDFVKTVEIYNEPDLKTRYLGEDITENNEYKGILYADMETAAYEAVKEVRPDMKVSALSFCRVTDTSRTTPFLTGAVSALAEYRDKTGEQPFDIISVHPYIGEINPEEGFNGSDSSYCDYHGYQHGYLYTYSIQGIVKHWQDVIAENGIAENSYNMSVTEYGSSNSLYGDYCAATEHEQAVNNLRSYLVMKGESFDQTDYIYDFMDDGVRRNTTEHNYGMVRNSSYRVPYAAKAGYLSTAALNNFLDGAVSSEYVYSEDYHNILKFDEGVRNVYVLWTSNRNGGSIAYDFDENTVFYDMYGNELDRAEITDDNGSYILSKEPYYAVSGEPINFPEKMTRNVLDISGHIASGNEDVNVSLTILPSWAEFGEGMINGIVYFDQAKTQSDGAFSFRVKNISDGEEYTAYVVAEDDTTPIVFNFTNEYYPTELNLYSGSGIIDSANFDIFDPENAFVEITFGSDVQSTDYTLVCAFYKESVLQGIRSASGTYAIGGENSVRHDISSDGDIEFDSVKIMLWNSISGMNPICDAKVISSE